MKLLLDTHVVLWWLRNDPKLGPKTRAAIIDPDNAVFVSVATPWEMSVKFRVGKLDERGSLAWPELEAAGIALLPMKASHLDVLETLPRRHGDPFDHLILAQAKAESATVVTSDRAMLHYGVPCLRS